MSLGIWTAGAELVLPFSHNLSVRLFCLENSSHNKPMAIKAARVLNKIYRVFWKATWLALNRFKRVLHHVDSVSYRKYRRSYLIEDSYVFSPGVRFSKAPESFRVRTAIFRLSVSKNGEVYTLETSCMKRASLHL